MATTHLTHSKSQIQGKKPSLRGKHVQFLSKSMEKSFHRYLNKPSARHAFVEAEAATYIAHQIRVLRMQRGWSQKDLAKIIGTTQTAISRIEDPSYARISFKTMVDLAKAFDVAPVIKFESTIKFLKERWTIDRDDLSILDFQTEANTVVFIENEKPQTPMGYIESSHITDQPKYLSSDPFKNLQYQIPDTDIKEVFF